MHWWPSQYYWLEHDMKSQYCISGLSDVPTSPREVTMGGETGWDKVASEWFWWRGRPSSGISEIPDVARECLNVRWRPVFPEAAITVLAAGRGIFVCVIRIFVFVSRNVISGRFGRIDSELTFSIPSHIAFSASSRSAFSAALRSAFCSGRILSTD